VSNPSAKNDPDGLGGIVNIVLKQQADLGTSGGFTAGGGSTGQVNANGNLGHQSGPWTLFGSYGFMHDRRTVSGFSSRNDFGTAAAGAALAADVAGVMRPESHSVTATAEYKAGGRDVLANNLVFNRRAMTRDFGSFYRALSSAGALTGRSDQRTDQDQGGTTADYALTWRHTPDEQRNKLVTELRLNGGSDGNDIFFSNAGRDPAGVPTGPAALETNATHERSRALFAQTDWTRELRRGTKLETGYKGIVRRQTSRFDVATATAAAAAARAAGSRPTRAGATPTRTTSRCTRPTRCSASAPGASTCRAGSASRRPTRASTSRPPAAATTSTTGAPSRARSRRSPTRAGGSSRRATASASAAPTCGSSTRSASARTSSRCSRATRGCAPSTRTPTSSACSSR
jgi:hypothetical protein